jgi:DNA-binding transcriptional LysR family regulator
MDIQHLRCLFAVLSSGSFTEACSIVHMSQSAISKKIISLETELGIRLIEREGHHHKLTHEGRRMLPNFIGIMENYDQATRMLDEIKTEKRSDGNSLRILCVPSASRYNVIGILENFSKKHPDIKITIDEMEPYRIMLMLRYSDYDLAFIGDINMNHDEYGTHFFQREEFMVVVPTGHPLAGKEELSLAELEGVPLILNRPESLLYYFCIDACEAAGFTPTVATTIARPLTALEYLHANKDYAYIGLKQTLVDNVSDLHCLIPLRDGPEFDFVFAWRKKTGLSKNASALLEYVSVLSES